MDLTSLANVKALLESDATWGTTWDTLVGYLITAISGEVEKFCNREFESKARTEQHDGGGKFVYLKCPPITKITSVKLSPIWDWAGTTAESSSNYVYEASTGMLFYIWSPWPYAEGAVQVVYEGGYANLAALPKALEGAVCKQVAHAFRRRKDLGLENVTFPDGSIQKINTEQFLPEVKTALLAFRRRSSR